MKGLDIEVRFVAHPQQRYPTAGDYFEKDGTLHFVISDTGNEQYNCLILLHELVERILTKARGITDEEIDAFDMAHLDSPDPGDEVDSPYREEHCIATGIERIVCAALNLSWKGYDNTILRLNDAD